MCQDILIKTRGRDLLVKLVGLEHITGLALPYAKSSRKVTISSLTEEINVWKNSLSVTEHARKGKTKRKAKGEKKGKGKKNKEKKKKEFAKHRIYTYAVSNKISIAKIRSKFELSKEIKFFSHQCYI